MREKEEKVLVLFVMLPVSVANLTLLTYLILS